VIEQQKDIPDYTIVSTLREVVNKMLESEYKFWVSFILTQYKTCWRDDTQFWIDHKNVECNFYEQIINSLEYVPIELFEKYEYSGWLFEYFNGIASILIYYGVFGIIILGIFSYYYFRNSNNLIFKTFLIICIAISIGTSNFFDHLFLFFMLFLSSLYKIDKKLLPLYYENSII
jgi:hypothetical protein